MVEAEILTQILCGARKAKKEGNAEVMNKIETTLKVAMAEKNKTLRPEIRLLNQVQFLYFQLLFVANGLLGYVGFSALVYGDLFQGSICLWNIYMPGGFAFVYSAFFLIHRWWVMQLLTDNGVQERAKTIQSNLDYLRTDSYFFQLLSRMLADVEKQRNNPKRLLLLAQLRTISKETKEAAKALKKSSN